MESEGRAAPEGFQSRLIEIESLDAPGVEVYAHLTERQLRSKLEPEKGLLIAESPKVISRALDAGLSCVSMLMGRKLVASCAELIERCGEVAVYTGDEALLRGLTGFNLTRGVLAAFRRPPLPSVEEVLSGARRVAVLENLVDHTNVGAAFRSAAALGADGVLVTPSCCDPFYRRSVRVSMGAVFQLPWCRIGNDASDWPHPGIERIRAHGFATAAFALEDDSVDIDDAALNAEERLALVFGTEGDGLAPATLAACDYTAKIPMDRGIDSLNVAAASAVAFWQLCRGSKSAHPTREQ